MLKRKNRNQSKRSYIILGTIAIFVTACILVTARSRLVLHRNSFLSLPRIRGSTKISSVGQSSSILIQEHSSVTAPVITQDGLDEPGACPEDCHQQVNVDLDGQVVHSGIQLQTNSAAECCEACKNSSLQTSADIGCNTWVWCPGQDAGCAEFKNQCWLKNQGNPRYAVARSSGAACPWTSGSLYQPDPSVLATARRLRIETYLGAIVIQLRPDWSPNTVAQVELIANESICSYCTFYRSEALWEVPYGPPYALVQGAISSTVVRSSDGQALLTKMRKEYSPSVQRGHVCLIGDGPNFFISLAAHPEWGSSHTVWGTVENMTLPDAIARLPVKNEVWGSVHVTTLITPIAFQLALEEAGTQKVAQPA